jgi:hypothetical protein
VGTGVAARKKLRIPAAASAKPMRITWRVTRQRFAQADELAAEGLVEFIDNPKHRRSKFVQLTSQGGVRYREMNARFLVIASTMGAALSEADIPRTIEIAG